MIVSASYRSDIPAFHAKWFAQKLAEGEVWVPNPYSGKPYRVGLDRDAATAFVFWSRNIHPFWEVLAGLATDARPFVIQFSLTGYPRALEAQVPALDTALAQARRLRESFGPKALVWRYDPILATDVTPLSWHRNQFARLSAAMAGLTDEVVVSWATLYAKTRRALKAAGTRHGFTWWDPEAEEKRALLAEMAGIAGAHGQRLTLCCQPDLLGTEVAAARCIDPERLSTVAGRVVAAKPKGHRPGCACAESRDVGAYDSCRHGCVYCYAGR